MGKLLNLAPKNLFQKKVQDGHEVSSKSFEEKHIDSSKSVPVSDSPKNSTELKSENVAEKIPNPRTDLPTGENSSTESLSSESFEEKLYNLERNFLFEQNNIIERFQQEKRDLIDDFKDEKLRVKRAYEHEKTELLKEIERKDKMLVELSKILKKQYEKNIEVEKNEMFKAFKNKIKLFKEIQVRIEAKLNGLKDVVENNETSNNLITQKLEHLQNTLSEFMNVTKSIDEIHCNHTESDSEKCLSLVLQSTKPEVENVANREDETTVVQQELAEAYRKQKSELLKLFNSEKEEYTKKIENEKFLFEKNVRLEYESRMQIERKAWQETIEDYEREVAILKFEREQMDRNYCVSMDELKTEFEREKRTLHRSYSVTQAELKKALGGYKLSPKELPAKHED